MKNREFYNRFKNLSQNSLNNTLYHACVNGLKNVTEYLLTSSELKEHANIHSGNDYGFRMACEYQHMEIIFFLIFDFNIEKTETIKKYLNEKLNQQVNELFTKREINKQLKKDLTIHQIIENDSDITKV